MKLLDHHVRLARHYLDIGNEDEARKTVLYWRLKAPMVDDIHFRWGEICEELGMIRPAMDSYSRALKINPCHEASFFRLAILYSDTGNFKRSIHFLKKLLKRNPNNREARELLAENYEKLGLVGKAKAISKMLEISDTHPHERYFPQSLGKEQVGKFKDLFSGREVGFAIVSPDQDTGDITYQYVPTPIAPEHVEKHLSGEITLAIYPLRSDNTVRFAGISFRIPSRVREAYAGQESFFTLLGEKMRSGVIGLAKLAKSVGIPAFPEEYDYHVYRLWFFFDQFEHFIRAKNFLKEFLSLATSAGNDLAKAGQSHYATELILPTRSLGIGWKEHPVVLPLGLNRATMKRSLFLDVDGKPFENQLKVILRCRPFPLRGALKRLRHQDTTRFHPTDKISFPHLVEQLMAKCPVIKHIISKAFSGHILRSEEKVALFYTVGLLDENGETIHRILELTPDYNYRKVKNQWERLKKNPVSCVRIRSLLPEVTASINCSCVFDLTGNKYPSPLLHVVPQLVPASSEGAVPRGLRLREAALRYIRLRRHIEEEMRTLRRLEEELDRHFTGKNINEYAIKGVRITRESEDNETRWQLEAT